MVRVSSLQILGVFIIWSMLFFSNSTRAEEHSLFERFSTMAGTTAVEVSNQLGNAIPHQWNKENSTALSQSGFASIARFSPLVWKIFNDRPHDNDVSHARSSNNAFAVLPPAGSGSYARVAFQLNYLPPLPAGHTWVLKANVGLGAREDRPHSPGGRVDIELGNNSNAKKIVSFKVLDQVVPLFLRLDLSSLPTNGKLLLTVRAVDSSIRDRVVFDAPTLEALPLSAPFSTLNSAMGFRISSQGSTNLGPAPFGIPASQNWPHGYYGSVNTRPLFAGLKSEARTLSVAPPSVANEELLLRFPLSSLSRHAEHTVLARFGIEDKAACQNSNTRLRVSFLAEGWEPLTQVVTNQTSHPQFVQQTLREIEIERGNARVLNAPLGILNRLAGARLTIRIKRLAGTAPCTNLIIDGLSVVASGEAKRVGVMWLPEYEGWSATSDPRLERLRLMANLFGNIAAPATPQPPFNAKGGIIRTGAREATKAADIAKAIADMKRMNFRVLLEFNPMREDFDEDANGYLPFNPQNDFFRGESRFKLTNFGAVHCVHKTTGSHYPKAPDIPCPAETDPKRVECLNQFDRAQRLPFVVFPSRGACQIDFVGVPHPDSHTDLSKAQKGICQNLAQQVDGKGVYIPPCRNAQHLPDHINKKCRARDPNNLNQWIIVSSAAYTDPVCISRYEFNAGYPRRVPGLSKVNVTKFRNRIETYMEAIRAETTQALDFIEVGNELNSAAFNDDFDIARPFDDVIDADALVGTVTNYRQILRAVRALRENSNLNSAFTGTQILLGGPAYYNRSHYQNDPNDDKEQRQGGKVPGWLFVEKIRVDRDADGVSHDRLTNVVDGVALHVYPAPDQLPMAKEMMNKFAAVVGKKMPLWITETGQHLMRFDIPEPPPNANGEILYAGPGFRPSNPIPLNLRPYTIFNTLQTLLANRFGNIRGAIIYDVDKCEKAALLTAWHRISDGVCVMPSEVLSNSVPYLPEARILGIYGP